MLSITTDYVKDTGRPEPYLEKIAEAGFTHIHWCHHWNTDFLYSKWEIAEIKKWLKDFGLEMLDLHASCGVEKNWGSLLEYERKAGVELVKNRIEMSEKLLCNVIILHIPREPVGIGGASLFSDQLRLSLDELRPFAKERSVRIALENLPYDDFERLKALLSEYGPDFLGFCYDSGHGILKGDGPEQLEVLKDRLISVHLHDNDGSGDQHLIPYQGKVDWEGLGRIIAKSAYERCVSMESNMSLFHVEDEDLFLKMAFEAGTVLENFIRKERE